MSSDFLMGLTKAIELIITLNPEIIEITLRSFRVSIIALVIASLIGMPVGIFLASWHFRGKKYLLVLIHSLMGLPPVLAGLILYLLLTANGLLGFLDLLFTEEAMMMVQFMLALPIIIGLTHNAIEQVPEEITEVALTLGADSVKLWKTILNEAKSGILLGIITALGRLLAEVGGILIVGGNIRFKTRTLTTSIVQEVQKGEFALALALGIILLTMSLLVNGGLTWYQFNQSTTQSSNHHERSRPLTLFGALTREKMEEIESLIDEFQQLPVDELIQEYLRLKNELSSTNEKNENVHVKELHFKDIHKEYNKKIVFSGISSTKPLAMGQLHGIIGPNGIGKSTLLKILSGILDAENGVITVRTDGESTIKLTFANPSSSLTKRSSVPTQASNSRNSIKRLLLSKVVYVHQHPVLLTGSCWDNITYVHGKDDKLARRLAVLLLCLVGLEDKIFHDARSLSGGQKQLLCFARSLAAFPDVLLVDEPTSNLDFKHMLKLEQILYQLAKSNDMLIIFTTHDLLQVQRLADDVGILKTDQLNWYDPNLIYDVDDPWITTMRQRVSEIMI